MEPRPTSPRSSQGQQPAAAGRPTEETRVYQPQPDPAMTAPQRSDYDYSPLDLAPPGQRRRRQLVAALIGGVVVLLLIAAAAFAIVALTGGDDDGGETDLAALQAQIATLEAGEGTPGADGTDGVDESVVADPSGENAAAQPTEAPVQEGAADETPAGEQPAAQPTEPPAQEGAAGGPTEAELQALLPDQSIMPQGLDAVADTVRTREEVVGALGGSREAETNLQTWGWTANVERSFSASDPAALAPDATTQIVVSLHGFASDQAAAEALTYYSDILLGLGYSEAEVGQIGANSRLLVQPLEDGGMNAALYVQQGPVLYRFGGYAPAGDPTTNLVNVAQAMLSQ